MLVTTCIRLRQTVLPEDVFVQPPRLTSDARRVFGPRAPDATNWGTRYSFELVDSPEQLDQMMAQSREEGTRARLVAGFCWKWSEVRPDGTLEPDVKIGAWERPWNAKVPKGKANPNPERVGTFIHKKPPWDEYGRVPMGCQSR